MFSNGPLSELFPDVLIPLHFLWGANRHTRGGPHWGLFPGATDGGPFGGSNVFWDGGIAPWWCGGGGRQRGHRFLVLFKHWAEGAPRGQIYTLWVVLNFQGRHWDLQFRGVRKK